MASLAQVTQWDDEADVLILGIGVAGCSAAIEAHAVDPDADILIVEKMEEKWCGGNSRASGQTLVFPEDIEKWKIYQQALNQPNPVPDDVLDAWGEERKVLLPWVQDIAAKAGMTFVAHRRRGPELIPPVPEFPDMPGSECIEYLATIEPMPSGVWNAFKANVDQLPVRKQYGTRVIDFVQDPDTLEVFGILAERDGKTVAIRGRRAVIICIGGYAANLQMQKDYFGTDRVHSVGSPSNVGEGIKILQKAGAELWHMRTFNTSGGYWPAMKVPDYPNAFFRSLQFVGKSFIEIGHDNKRFYDETFHYASTHYRTKEHGLWIDTFHVRVQPVHMIFDETFRKSNRLTLDRDWMGWNLVVEKYPWSQDNSVEIEKGWITKADSIRELAEKIGRDADEVEAEVKRFNEAARTGTDSEFAREADLMAPIENGPFYSIEIVPAIVCTTGGAKRNGKAEVISTAGDPIPRLYEAGELGSTHANLYQNGSFLTEAMSFGRIAGRNAVRLSSRSAPEKVPALA